MTLKLVKSLSPLIDMGYCYNKLGKASLVFRLSDYLEILSG